MTGQPAGEDMGEAGSHLELMDKVYRRQRHFYDFTRRYYLLGRDRMIRELAVQPGESVIEVGCGTARNLVRIARTYPAAELFGLDASSEMLRSARTSVERAGIAARVRLACGLAEDLAPAQFSRTAGFDHILFPYSLSMIPDWRGALAAAARCLAPGGKVHVVDFGDLAGIYPIFAKGLRAWLRLFHVTPRSELLAQVEKALGTGASSEMTALPGRYAFLWHGGAEELRRIARNPVS